MQCVNNIIYYYYAQTALFQLLLAANKSLRMVCTQVMKVNCDHNIS